MFITKSAALSAAVCLVIAHSALAASGPISVTTFQFDNSRAGANTNETALSPANVNTNTFGKVFTYALDGQVYAQPLLVTNVTIPGRGTHNVLYVATQHDSVFALDADNFLNLPYWSVSFINPPGTNTVSHSLDVPANNITPEIGITGTPVIDPSSGTLYVEARTRELVSGTTNFYHRLHALDITTGAERPGSPVIVAANNYPGIGATNVVSGGVTNFDTDGQGHVLWNPRQEQNRPGLLLLNGKVYITYASPGDIAPYHGWVFGFNATNLAPTDTNCITPNGWAGGIWMGGGAPAADTNGNIFLNTGNGNFDAVNQSNYADAYLKFSTTNGLQIADYFSPNNQSNLLAGDLDVSSAGLLLLPDSVGSLAHPHLLLGGSKGRALFLLDRDNLGHYQPLNDSQIVQGLTNATGQMFDPLVYWNGFFYVAGTSDSLKQFSIANATMSTTPVAQSTATFGNGAAPTLSASGNSNGILWVFYHSGTPVLRALNATNVASEIWNSSQLSSRDGLANNTGLRFTTPLVANGKVYVPTSTGVAVYGNSVFLPAPQISPNGNNFVNSQTVTLSDTYPGTSIYYTLDGTTPSTNSVLYSTPFIITNSCLVSAVATLPGTPNSPAATASFVNTAKLGGGVGLLGEYWNNVSSTNFTNASFTQNPTLTRTDAVVNFSWPNGTSPDPSIGATNYCIRWSGTLQPLYSQDYTIYAASDDGERVWINGQLLIDFWLGRGITTNSAVVHLNAQQLYNIRIDYYNGIQGAGMTLAWSSLSTPRAIIPQTQLYPFTNPPPAAILVSPSGGATYTAPASVTLDAAAAAITNSVASVAFYANSTLLGTLTNSPYILTATGLPAGSYNLTAVVTDGSGLTGTSDPVNITVNTATGQPYGLASRQASPGFFNMPQVVPAILPGSLPLTLSQTGVFADTPNMIPAAGLIPYSPNTPLWSDAALKTRWMSVPYDGGQETPGQQINFAPTGEWLFPSGTVFVKHFALTVDQTNTNVPPRRLETRLIVRDTNGTVYGVTYKWRPNNSDADLLTNSLTEIIAITNAGATNLQAWYYPSPGDCLTCHTPAASYVLGVKTRQLNGNLAYTNTGVTDNQLRTLDRLGLFNPSFDEASIGNFAQLVSVTNTSADLTNRFRSYIDANCSQCHRPGGSGGEAQFDARYDTALNSQGIVNGTVIGNLGYDNTHVITPKDLWRSILYDRVNSTDSQIKMPPLARNLVDTNAVAEIAAFINSLPGIPALAPPSITPSRGAFNAGVSVILSHPDTNASLYYTINGTLPTTNANHYTNIFALTNGTITVNASAFEAGHTNSVAVNATYVIYPDLLFAGSVSNGVFSVPLNAAPNLTYVLQASTNLTNWIPISTNVPLVSPFYLSDPNAGSFPKRFYRALQLP